MNGVHVYRFNSKIPSYSFLAWVFSMNQAMAEKAIDVISANNENIDLIHAHDWLVADAAMKVKNTFEKPLVSTIHATETGRRSGIHNEYQRTINEVERHLIDHSSRVICCSNYMANQVKDTFSVQPEKLYVIPNGVDASRFNSEVGIQAVRRRYAPHGEKIVVYVGRLVHEKGVHVLVGAVPKVLSNLPAVNFVIVGEGGMKEYLLKEAWDFGVADHIFFTGFVNEKRLIALYRASDAAVFPSLYEPFGITALEAMAAKTPVVVSDTGGLAEIVEHDKTGIKVYPDNSDSLAWGILRALQNQAVANRIRENAFQKVAKDYDWNRIADETLKIYYQAIAEGPRPAQQISLTIPFFRFDQYSEEARILLLLHFMGAVDAEHAKSAASLAEILGFTAARIRRLLLHLVGSGCVLVSRDSLRRLRFYLSQKGIIAACSLYS
jgi:glycosyltransferase involved in cell wall biosynthesis